MFGRFRTGEEAETEGGEALPEADWPDPLPDIAIDAC